MIVLRTGSVRCRRIGMMPSLRAWGCVCGSAAAGFVRVIMVAPVVMLMFMRSEVKILIRHHRNIDGQWTPALRQSRSARL